MCVSASGCGRVCVGVCGSVVCGCGNYNSNYSAGFRQGSPEFARVRQRLPEFARVRKSSPEFASVRQSSPGWGSAGFRRSSPEFVGVRRSLVEFARVSPEFARVRGQGSPEFAGVRRSSPEFARVRRSSPEFAGTGFARVHQSSPEFARLCNGRTRKTSMAPLLLWVVFFSPFRWVMVIRECFSKTTTTTTIQSGEAPF